MIWLRIHWRSVADVGLQIGLLEPKYHIQKMQQKAAQQREEAQIGDVENAMEGR